MAKDEVISRHKEGRLFMIERINRNDGITVLKLKGKLATFQCDDIEKEFNQVTEDDVKKIILDMSELTYISSSGLRLILILGQKIKNKSGCLVISSLTDLVFSVFQTTKFDKLFNIVPDIKSAEEMMK